MRSTQDDRYFALVARLKEHREQLGISQVELARRLAVAQSMVSKAETRERRLDVVELWDWLCALQTNPLKFLGELGWESGCPVGLSSEPPTENKAAIPVPKGVEETSDGINLLVQWQGQIKRIALEGVTRVQYLAIEAHVAKAFSELNDPTTKSSNREVICEALTYAIDAAPSLNPSDIYHHIIYRLYLREYRKSNAEQSWVRAGGEAMELFLARRYLTALEHGGVRIEALLSSSAKRKALAEMGLEGLVGDSKLDVVLYGSHKGKDVIFGGVHSKASLAERVSDDVPCSEKMMERGFVSILYTFDAKSFPPPKGDLVNKGELGTPTSPSDKRQYIELHGSFDACFSYNSRTYPSSHETKSGKRIHVCSMIPGQDRFPSYVIEAWRSYRQSKLDNLS